MTRLFHARISFGNYMLLSALLAVAVCFLWQVDMGSRQVIGIVFTVIIFLMVVVVERMINTTYTITDDGLVTVHNGRFSKDIIIAVSDISSIGQAGAGPFRSLVIKTREGVSICVRPDNEEDFIRKIEKLKKNNYDEDEEG